MRTIKFKAKRVDTGEWVFGYYFFNGNQHGIIDSKSFPGNWSEIDPETVCQFTGLVDKNGVEIYEGDILDSELYGLGTVRWDNQKSEFYVASKGNERSFVLSFGVVTGNIHDK